MGDTQQFSISLPLDMAEVVEQKVRSGAYETPSDVLGEGIRALVDRDSQLERWLRDEVMAGHREYMADPSKGVPAEALLEKIKTLSSDAK